MFLLSSICFATEFRLTNVSKGYDGDGEYYCLVPKDSIVKIYDYFMHDVRNNSSIDFSYGIYVIYQNEEILVNLEYLIPAETQDLFDSEILTHKVKENGRYWANNTVCEILKSNTRDSYYKIHKKKIDNYNSKRGIYDEMEWYEGVPFNGEHIENFFLILDDGRKYTYYYFIKKIEKKTNGYRVTCELTDSRIEDSDYTNTLLEKLKDKQNIIFNLVLDGDYLNFYSEDNQLLYTYVLVDKAFTEQYENLILKNKYDSSKVTWPRHADGTCDYDGSKKAVTVQTAAEEPVFILKKDLTLKDVDWNEHEFFKGDKFLFDYTKKGFGVDLDNPLSIEIYFKDTNGTSYTSNINDVYLDGYDFKISENISKDYWIPSYYYDLLKSNTPLDDVLKYEKYWATKIIQSRYDEDVTWKDEFSILRYYFGDFYFVVFGRHVYDDVDFFAYLEEVSDNKIIYNVQRIYSHFFDYKEQTIYVQPEYISLFEKETPFKIILTIDGDYMKMYIDEVSEENLFQTLIRTTPEACNQIEKWIKGESDDLSKVVIPKKLSIQNESSKAIFSSNVSPNKTMLVTENLKLRSGEATTSEVLTVMSAGTKVKILELGKSETIDGINSNWVKVEVLSGAKDRDGRAIQAGTVGWCYGGYLK